MDQAGCGIRHAGETLQLPPQGEEKEVESMTDDTPADFDPPLDAGIYTAVVALRRRRVETFESCEGGLGHAYPEPTVRFHGGSGEGFRALGVAIEEGLRVAELRRVWPVQNKKPTGPWWEITFATVPTMDPEL